MRVVKSQSSTTCNESVTDSSGECMDCVILPAIPGIQNFTYFDATIYTLRGIKSNVMEKGMAIEPRLGILSQESQWQGQDPSAAAGHGPDTRYTYMIMLYSSEF